MIKLALPVALVAALLPLGCGGGGTAARTDKRHATPAPGAATPVRALCSRLGARVTGRAAAAAGSELSGLALSRSQPRVLWAVNDSGDRPRILALAPTGRLLADVAVTGARNVDWEDIAAGPGSMLDVADIGDNDAVRPAIDVYRMPEPRLGDGALTATAPAQRFRLRYPDGAHDAEALLVDPRTGALVIVTKDYSGHAGVYAADRPASGAVTVLRHAGSVELGSGGAVTAGDVSVDGRTVVLRTYGQAFAFSRRRGEPLARALAHKPCTAGAGLLDEGQGESLALTRDGTAFFTVPEGERAKLRLYAPAR